MLDIPYKSRNKIAYQAFSEWDKTLDEWMKSLGNGNPEFGVGSELYNWRKHRYSVRSSSNQSNNLGSFCCI